MNEKEQSGPQNRVTLHNSLGDWLVNVIFRFLHFGKRASNVSVSPIILF